MNETQQSAVTHARSDRGFTLVEVMVSAVILLLVFFGLANVYSTSRRQLVHEEDRRNATAIAQARMESLRRDYDNRDLPNLVDNDTTYVVAGRSFIVAHAVAAEAPEDRATTVTITVSWSSNYNGTTLNRSLDCTTILGRSSD